MLIAISTHPQTQQVERFGHDFPIVMHRVEGGQLLESEPREAVGGCCGTLAKSLAGTDFLICTGLGQGAARHLGGLGVQVAVVPEGVPASEALAALLSQALPSGEVVATKCPEHAEGHTCGCHGEDAKPAHSCGCHGEDAKPTHSCGCHGEDANPTHSCGCHGEDANPATAAH